MEFKRDFADPLQSPCLRAHATIASPTGSASRTSAAMRLPWSAYNESEFVPIVASIAARDRAEKAAANSIAGMLRLEVTLTEVGERCGLPLKEVVRLKRCYLDSAVAMPPELMGRDDQPPRPSLPVNGGQRS